MTVDDLIAKYDRIWMGSQVEIPWIEHSVMQRAMGGVPTGTWISITYPRLAWLAILRAAQKEEPPASETKDFEVNDFDIDALRRRIKHYKGTDNLVVISEIERKAVLALSMFPIAPVGVLHETKESVYHAHEWWNAVESACRQALIKVKQRILE